MSRKWNRNPFTLPSNPVQEEKIQRMTDQELEAEAGPMLIYRLASGHFVAVSTRDVLSKEEMVDALHDLTEAIELHGFPSRPMILTKKDRRN
jgi:hypothetical protein